MNWQGSSRLTAAWRSLAEPHVVTMRGWSRDMWYDETGLPFIQASPNLPTLDSYTLYPGTCFFEATTLSEGRGTTRPFEYIGAPWVDPTALAEDLRARNLPGVGFRATSFVPMFHKHQGETCRGVQVHVFDREAFRPVEMGVHLIHAFRNLDESRFAWRPGSARGISANLLYGSEHLHTMIDADATPTEIMVLWDESHHVFRESAQAAHLY